MNPILFAIPVFLLTIVLEAWWARRRGLAVYDIPDAVTSLHHGVLSQLTGAFTKVATLGIGAHGEQAILFIQGRAIVGKAQKGGAKYGHV